MSITTENITIHRIKNDINGNPRIVIGWLALLQCEAMRQWDEDKCKDGEFDARFKRKGLSYDLAASIASNVGFKRYRAIGGGLVAQSYNDQELLDSLQWECEDFVADNTTNQALTDHILSCIDLAEYDCKDLHDIVKSEKHAARLTLKIVEDWLRGLPSAVSLPYMNHDQEQICISCGLIGWTSDMYWRYAAKVILAYKV